MITVNPHIISPLVLIAYLAGSLLLELTHHDATNLALSSEPVVSTHACGEKELHVSLNDTRHCLSCTHSFHRFSVLASHSTKVDTSLVCIAFLVHRSEQLHEADLHHSGKRGPPSA